MNNIDLVLGYPGDILHIQYTYTAKKIYRAVGRSENPGVPVVIRWA